MASKSPHAVPGRRRGALEIAVRDTGIGIRAGPDRHAVRGFRAGRRFDQPRNSAAPGSALPSRSASSSRWAARSGSSSTSASARPSPSRLTCRRPTSALGGGARRHRQRRFRDLLATPAAAAAVLLAEDNATNQLVFSKLMQGNSRRHHDRGERPRAGACCAPATFDVVFMDMRMPEMDGLEATRAIRALAGRAAVPIIALTANAFADDIKACRDAGMDAFIAKPIRKSRNVIETLAAALVGHPLLAESSWRTRRLGRKEGVMCSRFRCCPRRRRRKPRRPLTRPSWTIGLFQRLIGGHRRRQRADHRRRVSGRDREVPGAASTAVLLQRPQAHRRRGPHPQGWIREPPACASSPSSR